MREPPYGWSTKGKVIKVVDGDTIDVEITRVLRIRLIDVDSAETRTRNRREKKAGLIQKAVLLEKVLGKFVKLFIPHDYDEDFKAIFTFGRALGRIFYRKQDINSYMKKEIGDNTHTNMSKKSSKT